MAKNRKNTRKLRNLITICALFAIVLSVGTYAWFIGMKTVNIAKFEIEIQTTEGLFLSMDGEDWQYNLNVATAHQYDGNTNTWATDGLIPMSSIGDADSDASRMKLYEKASLTASGGGYRLLTSRVDNYTETAPDSGVLNQGKGYVAFDLFIKNISGEEYYATDEPLNEEAIYLTTNSKVEVGEAGIENTGIENSIRVAFMQVGRVKGTIENAALITGITCADAGTNEDTDKVTGICRNAQIWEPNDTKHVTNAINWYSTACKKRKAAPDGNVVSNPESYDKAQECAEIADTNPYPTYAVSKEIVITDQVDVYDGSFNTYTDNTNTYANYIAAEDKSTFKLVEYPYFTDTMKNLTGNARPQFMSLAPNSITKVRVYIYLEGQDIDNYDFASLGKQISVNFGFTKERYTEGDVDYHGPSTDITPTGSI